MKVKHAELGNAACGVRAVVAPGSDSNHVESQPTPVHRQVLFPVFRTKGISKCCRSAGKRNLERSDHTS